MKIPCITIVIRQFIGTHGVTMGKFMVTRCTDPCKFTGQHRQSTAERRLSPSMSPE